MNMNQMNMNPMNMNQMNSMSNSMNNLGMNNMGISDMSMNTLGMNPMMMNNMMGGNNMGMMNPMMMNNMMGGNNMGMMNPMMMNNMMGGNNMGMMNPMMMMNAKQKEEWKKKQMYQGYLMGKKMMEEKKRQQGIGGSQTTAQTAPAADANEAQSNPPGEITVKFIKGGTTTNININSNDMVAELIDKYFKKTNTTTGTFNFNGNNLDPMDCTGLNELGIRDGSQINVS